VKWLVLTEELFAVIGVSDAEQICFLTKLISRNIFISPEYDTVDKSKNWETTTYPELLGHELSAWQNFIQRKYKRAKKYDTLHTHLL